MRYAWMVVSMVLGCSDSGGGSSNGPDVTDVTRADSSPADTTPTFDTVFDGSSELPIDTTPSEVVETTVETGDGADGETVTGTTGVSPLTGVNTDVTVTSPTRNPACDTSEVDPGPHGATYPWGGLTAGGQEYTCNRCPS